MQGRVLVADSGRGTAAEVVGILEAAGYRVERLPTERISADSIEELRRIGEGPEALLLDLPPGSRDTLELLAELPADLPVVALLSGAGERAVLPLRLGADDALVLPVDPEELTLRLARAIERRRIPPAGGRNRRALASPSSLLGSSPAIRRVRDQIARAAPGRATVLLTGETGTGKELAATAIHESSPRAPSPFIRVNCAALPETLLESELFGHERGAFTGAEQRRIGRFEEAHEGTLLLDEVGDMHPRTQAKVLRVLQEREFERLGGSRSIRVDVRILAATNQELEELTAAGKFRADLFFRLNVVLIHLPALRDRPEDIPLLADVFLCEFNQESAGPKKGFAPAALEALRDYTWPGNVRELRNAVQRAVLMGAGDWIDSSDLSLPAVGSISGEPAPAAGRLVSLPEGGVDPLEVERALIVQALGRTGWVQKDAAALLRMSRRRLNYRIGKLGIRHSSWRRNRP